LFRMFLSGLYFRSRPMELITRVLAGVIATWIPMDGEDRRRHDNVRVSVESLLPPVNRTIAVTKGAEHKVLPFDKPRL
jgi:hypothetical protein